MKIIHWIVAIAFACSGIAVNAELLVVFGDESYPPVIHLRDGKPAGILPAIFTRIETLTGDKYDLRLTPWKRAYEQALRGEGGVTNISFNEERDKIFDFSKPIYDDDIQIVTLKDRSFPYSSLADLKGKVVGGLNGAAYGADVDKAIAAGLFTIERDFSQVGRLRKLLAGRQDAAFVGNGQIGFNLIIDSSDELRAQRDKFVILPTPLARDPLHLAFAKSMNKRAALERFDAALDKLRKSGELKKLAAEASRVATP